MGKIIQKGKIQNAGDLFAAKSGYIHVDQVRKMDVEFLVDTGAAMLCLPIDVIESLGLFEEGTRRALTANGEVVRRIFSSVRVYVQDRDANVAVMELPIGVPPLLGYIALEALDLYPNLKEQILEGNPKYDGKMIIDLL